MSSTVIRYRLVGAGLALFLALMPAGCGGTQLVGEGPFLPSGPKPSAGVVRYSLAKTTVTVAATVGKQVSSTVSFGNGEFSFKKTTILKESKATVSLAAVPDETQFFTLRLEPGETSDDNLTIKTTRARPGKC